MSLLYSTPSMWDSGTNQNSVPSNDNARRFMISVKNGVADDVTAQPAMTSPADDGKWYIIPAAATGSQWATFAEDSIAVFDSGTWYEFTPVEGDKVTVDGVIVTYESGAWVPFTVPAAATWGAITGTLSDQTDLQAALDAVSPIGLHSVPIMAGAILPSVTGGCSAVTSIASAANQPDIVTIDFDPTTQEYAQFAIPMPKSWNEGTLTAEFRWSHAATTTNFGVVWDIQAVAVSNDDTIAVNFGTAQQIADTGGTTNDLYVTSQTPAMTVGGTPAAGDTVFFRVSRVTGDGSDNMAVDARLHSVVLYMTTDASTDA